MRTTDSDTAGRRAGHRLALRAGAGALTVSAIGGAASWKAADTLLRPRAAPDLLLRLAEVVPAEPDPRLTVRFGRHAGALVYFVGLSDGLPGTWGLMWSTGFGVIRDHGVGDAGDGMAGRGAARSLLLLRGNLPRPDAGPITAVLRPSCWPEAPDAGPVPVREHRVDGPLGPLPCWSSPTTRATHVVLVHGRMAHKAQLWRHLAALAPADVSFTVASYRNDVGAPATGLYELGTGEWADIEAIVDAAVREGAERIVLVGMSMGGAIVAQLLARTTHGPRIAGVVLDAPVLDWGSVLRHVTGGRPGAVLRPLIPAVLALAAHRANLDRRGLQVLVDADRLAVPVLLFHGSADRVVPVGTSDSLAAARPDLVRYQRVDGAGHVTAWNADPDRYDAALRGFLRTVG